MMRKIGLAALGALLVGGIVAAPVQAATTASVSTPGFFFSPATVFIDFDQNANSITFTNTHTAPHHPRSDAHNGALEGACLNGPVINPGGSAVVPITWTGQCFAAIASWNGFGAGTATIRYHCHIHAGMVGSIVVDLPV